MPSRANPIVTDQVYHVFNRSVGGIPIFHSKRDYQRFYDVIDYYRFCDPQIRFSFYHQANKEIKESVFTSLHTSESYVSIMAYALMPNHFHFVMRQEKDNGISAFMRLVQNSYAKYFNVKYKRFGALFQALFKCVRIESDEQLLHVVRYVHLNPMTSYILKTVEELEVYPWTSFRTYLSTSINSLIDEELVMSHFNSLESFRAFTNDQADYQRILTEMRHVCLDSDV